MNHNGCVTMTEVKEFWRATDEGCQANKVANPVPAAVRDLHDNRGDPPGEHANRNDGQHVSEDSGDAQRVAAAVGADRTRGGARRAAGAAAPAAAGLQPADGQWEEGAGAEDQPDGEKERKVGQANLLQNESPCKIEKVLFLKQKRSFTNDYLFFFAIDRQIIPLFYKH